MIRRLKKRKGQGTLEYVILISAIIAVVLVVVNTIKTNINTGLTNAAGNMEESLSTAFPTPTAGGG